VVNDVTCTLDVSWDDGLIQYDFGPGHPLAPVRVELTMALARSFGIFDYPSVTVTVPQPATDGELELVHDPGYIDAVRRAGRTGRPDLAHGLGTPDDPVFAGMHEASALVAGAMIV
jgi:acetoin utilization protein AcuC